MTQWNAKQKKKKKRKQNKIVLCFFCTDHQLRIKVKEVFDSKIPHATRLILVKKLTEIGGPFHANMQNQMFANLVLKVENMVFKESTTRESYACHCSAVVQELRKSKSLIDALKAFKPPPAAPKTPLERLIMTNQQLIDNAYPTEFSVYYFWLSFVCVCVCTYVCTQTFVTHIFLFLFFGFLCALCVSVKLKMDTKKQKKSKQNQTNANKKTKQKNRANLKLDGWVKSPAKGAIKPRRKKQEIIAIDCEMVRTTEGSELARVSMVDMKLMVT